MAAFQTAATVLTSGHHLFGTIRLLPLQLATLLEAKAQTVVMTRPALAFIAVVVVDPGAINVGGVVVESVVVSLANAAIVVVLAVMWCLFFNLLLLYFGVLSWNACDRLRFLCILAY